MTKKVVHLFRHTANEGDTLTADGVVAAVAIGARLTSDYSIAVSSGAQRATQTIACILGRLGSTASEGVVVVEALRSTREDQWREAYRKAGAGDLESLRAADPDLVAIDSPALAEGLRAAFALLAEGGRALAVGHGPTNEAAVYGLTGVVIDPLGKGDGIEITLTDGEFTLRPT